MSAESVFVRDGEVLVPTEHARGPWDPMALHGGAPAALMVAAFERMQAPAPLAIARLGFEFLRPIPSAPLRLETSLVRPGRRVQELACVLRAESDGFSEVIARASALRVSELPDDLPAQALAQDGAGLAQSAHAMVGRESGRTVTAVLDGDDGRASFGASMEMRWLTDPWSLGEGRLWMRLSRPLVDGESTSALSRLAAAADFGNGVSAALPFERFVFINADLTIHLLRQPRGEWTGLDARTLLRAGGTALSESVLHDEHGPVGRAFQTLVVAPRSS